MTHPAPHRPLALLSNDDGIDSFFLLALAEALAERLEVVVVAPADEQSWVGRAMTRHGELTARRVEGFPCEAWSLTGRPADCVNVGLHHLLGGRRPDVVVSGMNLGFNASLNLTLGSGTVGAATEGALAGLRAVAFSLSIPPDDFERVAAARGRRGAGGDAVTRAAAARCLELTLELLVGPSSWEESGGLSHVVYNVNLPAWVDAGTPVVNTTLARGPMPSLFERLDGGEEEGVARLQFGFSRRWEHTYLPDHCDLVALRAGAISRCALDWARVACAGDQSAPPRR